MEGGALLRVFGDEIQKVPLRHEGDEMAPRRQVCEVGDGDLLAAYVSPELLDLLVRPFQKLFEQSEFVHDVERRGMDRVSSKVAEKIAVLFQNDDVHPGPSQQESK